MENEPLIRLFFFAAAFVLFAIIERLWPRRHDDMQRPNRWVTNLSLTVISALCVRYTMPIVAVAAAIWAQQQQFGLFQWLELNPLVAFTLGLLLLDFAIWFQHLASHKLPLLWRLHRVHHADKAIDVTTAFRFHPLEIMLSMLWKVAVVTLLGLSPWCVIVFEIVLNAAAQFNHANIALPKWIDNPLRWVIVTPDMHRIHHSVKAKETDSNYGFNLSIWDRLFATYKSAPEGGQQHMTIGLSYIDQATSKSLGHQLLLPFKKLGKVPTKRN
ncbi:sterol desaturase family protein [Polycladidibacter stylochi]|uniref:sterol desaturase family protein n=1 Tax=Polycladidibacter stylochi TaxID=1807766 RepID=UPI00082C90EE|nr:sterol desaturase family protein [Pseudovibrio stylochi]